MQLERTTGRATVWRLAYDNPGETTPAFAYVTSGSRHRPHRSVRRYYGSDAVNTKLRAATKLWGHYDLVAHFTLAVSVPRGELSDDVIVAAATRATRAALNDPAGTRSLLVVRDFTRRAATQPWLRVLCEQPHGVAATGTLAAVVEVGAVTGTTLGSCDTLRVVVDDRAVRTEGLRLTAELVDDQTDAVALAGLFDAACSLAES